MKNLIENKYEILKKLNHTEITTLAQTFGIIFTDLSENSLTATMPITEKVHQIHGILHGGASVALAETVGSCLSAIHIDEKFVAVGSSINSYHLKPKKEGILTATASFIRKGKTIHTCQIEIRDEKNQLINHTTMTNAIIIKP